MTQGSNAEFINNLLSSCSGYLFIMEPNSFECYWPQYILQRIELPKQRGGIECFAGQIFLKEDSRRFVDDCHKVAEGTCPCLIGSYQCLPGIQEEGRICIRMWMLAAGYSPSRRYLVGMIREENKNCSFDLVTGIPNNVSFRKYLSKQVSQGGSWCVLMLGIDDFANINELYSYSVGDQLLNAFASRVQKLLPEHAFMFRLDGDKFGLLFMDWDGAKGKAWYETFRESCIAEKFNGGGNTLFLSASGGLCCFPKDGKDFEAIYHNASKALQKAKENGKNHLVVYSKELADQDKRTASLLEALRESVIMGFCGFYMRYQPIVRAEDLSLVGGEALIRWRCPGLWENQEISPSEFIPILEENGLILEAGNWALETAVRQCAQWIQHEPDFQMHINVSSRQFEAPSFRYHLLEVLDRYHVKPANIILELTESGKVKEMSVLSREFDFIRSQGIRISLDDFGTGYSSLEVLRLLSADEMKIDRSFLERISYDTTDQALLSTLINLSHKMNMAVCVEGIENKQLQEQVCRMKPDLLQGYYYSPPLKGEEFAVKYFTVTSEKALKEKAFRGQAYRQSLVYAEFRPAQPLKAQELIDNVYAGIIQIGIDEKFTFLSCNEGGRRMLGYTSQEMDELFANQALGFVHPDDMEYVNNEIRRQMGLGDTVTAEFRLVRKDGAPIWVLGRGTVYRSRDGSTSLIVVAINNDQRKRAQLEKERQFLLQDQMLNQLLAGVMCLRFDRDLTIEYMSKRFLDLLGFTKEDVNRIFDNKYRNMIYEKDRPMELGDILGQKDRKVLTMKYRVKCKDGRLVRLKTVSRLEAADTDGIQRIFSVVVDITDVKKDMLEKSKGLKRTNCYGQGQGQRGEWFSVSMSLPERLKSNSVAVVENILDINKDKWDEERFLMESQQDSVTELFNKASTEEKIRGVLKEAGREKHYALFMLDIEHLKKINDTFGHMTGDAILRLVAERLTGQFCKDDIIGRIGGDEFLLLTSYSGDVQEVIRKAKEMKEAICQPLFIKELSVNITVSMGIACYPGDGTEFYTLYRSADSALYRCKAMNRNGYCLSSLYHLEED